MQNTIKFITPPDDLLEISPRLTIVNFTEDQSKFLSLTLNQIGDFDSLFIYVWRTGQSTAWLMDKIVKSDLIVFNADLKVDGITEMINGYLAAQKKSYYLGSLRELEIINNRHINDVNEFVELIKKHCI